VITEGAWVLGRYGYEYRLFYVKGVIDDQVVLGSPQWCASANTTLPLAEIESKWRVIWYAKRRWWWRFMPTRDLICPYQKPPRAVLPGFL
jgi:hypothetical protein